MELSSVLSIRSPVSVNGRAFTIGAPTFVLVPSAKRLIIKIEIISIKIALFIALTPFCGIIVMIIR
jgi:hypothetical protein